MILRDSIEALHNSEAYQDSIQEAYNKITFLEVIWDGIGIRNNAKKKHWYIGSLAAMIDFEVVGGFRIGPYLSHFKRWETGRYMRVSGQVNLGLLNKDVQGYADYFMRYDPHKLADFRLGLGRNFASINPYDAYLNQFRPSNYILHNSFYFGHRIELFNGFYLDGELSFSDRQSINDYDTETFWTDFFWTR